MGGFEALDLAMVESELEMFLPEVAAITRRASAQTKGDYIKGVATVIATGVACRVQPITPLGTEKTRLKSFPASMVERAEYLVTLDNSIVYKDGDTVTTSNGLEYALIAVRFDNASWRPVVRAVAIRVE